MDNNKLKLAEERFYSRFEALNSEILQEFGETPYQIGVVTDTPGVKFSGGSFE